MSDAMPPQRIAFAPGRVTLMGDHTDYAGGLALTMAIQLGTTIDVRVGGPRVELRSASEADAASVAIDSAAPAAERGWARYVAAVVAEVSPAEGVSGEVHTTLPIGAGLSSSAALEVALALALGATGDQLELARSCQRAEHAAVGVPSGIMDQLSSICGRAGHALQMDFEQLQVDPVPFPSDVHVWVVHSGVARSLADTPYALRRSEAEAAARTLGPLAHSTPADIARLADPALRRRARHVLTESARVRAMAAAFAAADGIALAAIMRESAASLRDDMEVSTPTLDAVSSCSLGPMW
jgi:galactokinase